MTFGTDQDVMHGEPRALRRVRDLADELPHRQVPQERRLHPAIGDEQGSSLVGVPGLERFEIRMDGSLHGPYPAAFTLARQVVSSLPPVPPGGGFSVMNTAMSQALRIPTKRSASVRTATPYKASVCQRQTSNPSRASAA